jgi:hypothetical protein
VYGGFDRDSLIDNNITAIDGVNRSVDEKGLIKMPEWESKLAAYAL